MLFLFSFLSDLRRSHRIKFLFQLLYLLSISLNFLQMIFIFSSVLLSNVCTLSGMRLYTVVSPYSSLSVHSFSSSFSEVNWSQVICNISHDPPTNFQVGGIRADLDCTSCITLAWSPYSAFVGICAMNTSKWSMSPMGFCMVS
jgi:hypothetical protein